MRNLPVHWSEGMFLRPQHFQAADRYWTEILQTSEHWDHQYNYGVRHLEISADALANFQFQVNVCHARMKDGTLISLDPGQEPDRVSLKEPLDSLGAALSHLKVDLQQGFESETTLRVYLACPKLKMGVANVGRDGDGGKTRFGEVQQSIQDEGRGGNDQEISLRSLSVRLLLSTQDLAGYELLPIAQIQRVGQQGSLPQLDLQYFPPLLAVDAWPPLGRDIVRAIYDMVGKKIEVLSEQVISRGISLGSHEPGDMDRVLMLLLLNESYATLRILAFAAGVHPFDAYVELVRLVGKLAIFGKERRLPDVPLYDHDDLARIYYWVKEQIDRLLHMVRDYEFEQRFFVGAGLGMQVALEPKWLNTDWQWYVGVFRGNISEKECLDLLTAGPLPWKLGSGRQVDILFKNRAEGLHLRPLDRAPRALPANRECIYFEVSRGNAAWKDVQETQSVAMRLQEGLIVNRNELQGQRQLIVNHQGKQAALQFALFAVPIRT